MFDERTLADLDGHRSRLIRAAARLLGSTAEAEDVVQDSYLRALENRTAAAPDVAQAWLTTMVKNLAIDTLRRRDWMRKWLLEVETQALAPAAPSAEADAQRAEEADRALHAIASRLDRSDGAALLLREVFGVTHAEIAAASGKTESACRQQLRRALMRVRGTPAVDELTEDEGAFHQYRLSLRQRDAQGLFAMLQPPATARLASPTTTRAFARPKALDAPLPSHVVSQVVQIDGRLALMLSLDGHVLCVLPLGACRHPFEDAASVADYDTVPTPA